MPIRLPTDAEATAMGFVGPACQRRREVLRETLQAFGRYRYPTAFHQAAAANVERWKCSTPARASAGQVLVLPGDWGAVTRELSERFGACFAVLNMANAYFPGGAYGEGAPAQEENLFRRTDCHFHVEREELNEDGRTYNPGMSRLLQGLDGRVYLDTTRPRVCVRDQEVKEDANLGYAWLATDDIFPFFELRASAQDLRNGAAFDPHRARRTIKAIFATLAAAGIKHAVLSALGCGAFRNPASEVAAIFRDELICAAGQFQVVAFAIHSPGYGHDNFTVFAEALQGVA